MRGLISSIVGSGEPPTDDDRGKGPTARIFDAAVESQMKVTVPAMAVFLLVILAVSWRVTIIPRTNVAWKEAAAISSQFRLLKRPTALSMSMLPIVCPMSRGNEAALQEQLSEYVSSWLQKEKSSAPVRLLYEHNVDSSRFCSAIAGWRAGDRDDLQDDKVDMDELSQEGSDMTLIVTADEIDQAQLFVLRSRTAVLQLPIRDPRRSVKALSAAVETIRELADRSKVHFNQLKPHKIFKDLAAAPPTALTLNLLLLSDGAPGELVWNADTSEEAFSGFQPIVDRLSRLYEVELVRQTRQATGLAGTLREEFERRAGGGKEPEEGALPLHVGDLSDAWLSHELLPSPAEDPSIVWSFGIYLLWTDDNESPKEVRIDIEDWGTLVVFKLSPDALVRGHMTQFGWTKIALPPPLVAVAVEHWAAHIRGALGLPLTELRMYAKKGNNRPDLKIHWSPPGPGAMTDWEMRLLSKEIAFNFLSLTSQNLAALRSLFNDLRDLPIDANFAYVHSESCVPLMKDAFAYLRECLEENNRCKNYEAVLSARKAFHESLELLRAPQTQADTFFSTQFKLGVYVPILVPLVGMVLGVAASEWTHRLKKEEEGTSSSTTTKRIDHLKTASNGL